MRRSSRDERERIRISAQSLSRSRIATSPSPRITSPTIHSPSSRRKSARIARLRNEETNYELPNTTSTMADVARRRNLGSRSVRSRHHSENAHTSGRSRSGQHFLSPEDIRYAMDFIVQPPGTARAGQIMAGSMVVRLCTTNADPSEAVASSTNLVGVATLIPDPILSTSIDASLLNTALVGRRLDSIHPFADDEADGSIASMDMANPNGVGYMSFPELSIRRPGTYRIRITLIRIHPSSGEPRAESAGNGSSMHTAESTPIVVSGSEASYDFGRPDGT